MNTPTPNTLYQIFEFEESLDADSVNKYIEDRGFRITVPLGTQNTPTIPREILRAYGYPARKGYKKLLCYKHEEAR